MPPRKDSICYSCSQKETCQVYLKISENGYIDSCAYYDKVRGECSQSYTSMA